MKKIFIPIFILSVVFTACQSNGSSEQPSEEVTPDHAEFKATDDGADIKEYPIIKFENKSIDIGTMTEGEIRKFKYFFTNTGNADLIVKEAQGSCGCTVPSFSKTPIKPGESGVIDVEFDSNGKLGENSKNVTVWTNCKEPQELLTFRALVTEAK